LSFISKFSLKQGDAANGLSRQAIVSFLIALLVTLLLFFSAIKLENNRIKSDFENHAKSRFNAIESSLQKVVYDLSAVSRLLSVSTGVINIEQFQSFVRPMLQQHQYIQNFAFHRIVSDVERPGFEAGIREQFPNFSITEVESGRVIAAKKRDHYRVITYLEPMEGSEAAFGLDVSTRSQQTAAATRACQTGLPFATESYTLVHRSHTLRGFVLLAPVYKQGILLKAPVELCNAIYGYVAAVFDVEGLIKMALSKHRLLVNKDYMVLVYAGNAADEEKLLFLTGASAGANNLVATFLRKIFASAPARLSAKFEVAGRHWLVMVSMPPAAPLELHLASLLILFGGIIISTLIAAYTQSTVVRSRRERQLIAQHADKMQKDAELENINRALQDERNYLLELFKQAPGFVAILLGPKHIYSVANNSYYQLVGQRDLIGKPVREAIPELKDQGFIELLDQVYTTGETHLGKNVPIAIKNDLSQTDEIRYVDFVYQPMTDANGNVTGIFVQGNDISQQKQAQTKLEYLSNYDQTTGLPNYAHVLKKLGSMLRYVDNGEYSVIAMVIDIDRFRSVNEKYGQAIADQLLKAVAGRLETMAQGIGEAAKLSGDRFLLAIYSAPNEHAYQERINDVNDRLGEIFKLDGREVFVSFSLGVAIGPADAQDAEVLTQCADFAMYSSKESGSGNCNFYSKAQNERIQHRLKIEKDLGKALECSEFTLFYQPQIDLQTGSIVGLESLLRWQHPELGMLSPNEFISVAEDSGLIIPLGGWALRTACAQLKTWQDCGHSELRMAVNLSARQFAQKDLGKQIHSILDEIGLEAKYLDLELTESLVMTDIEQAIDILNELNKLGVQISIDDFGTGYSSLAYLKRFPLDVLKIDRSFIREIPDNGNDAAIADAIISMSHSLGMRVVAEGVETEAQCEFLSRNLCDEIQGFFFSKPLPAEEIGLLLSEKRRLPDHLLRLQKPARTLLLVDDEPSILSALRRQFRQDGYEIMTATDGQKGLELLAHNKIDVIVSDQRMPGMTGVEFLRKVKNLYPDTVRIVLSGFTELQSVTDAVNEGAIYKFLTKPWDDTQLRKQVAEAFQHKEMSDENRRLNIEVRTANQELASANRQLEELIQHKQQQIYRREVSLDIVREALQHVPLPVIGLDEDNFIVFTNIAANDLFKTAGALLGNPIELFIPVLSNGIPEHKAEEFCTVEIGGMRFEAAARRMGHGTQSRGSLIIFTSQS
jgi:diguanylate cyclase (GGDEF)-like protein